MNLVAKYWCWYRDRMHNINRSLDLNFVPEWKKMLEHVKGGVGSSWPLVRNETAGLFYLYPNTAACAMPLSYYSGLFAMRQSDVSRLPPLTSHSLADSFAVRIWNMAVACGPYITLPPPPPPPTFAPWKNEALLRVGWNCMAFTSLLN